MENNLQTQNNNAPLTTPMNPMQAVMSADSADFIMGLRIKNPNSENLSGEPGEWVYANDKPLGKEIKVVTGPWRMSAMRFKGNNLDLKSNNRTKNAKFQFNQSLNRYEWDYPDFSKDFYEIFKCVQPDRGTACRNLNGIDVLLWLPDFNLWAVWFCAAKQKSINKYVIESLIGNAHTTFMLGTEKGPGKNHYYIPTLRKCTETINLPPDTEEMINKFIDTDIEVSMEEATRLQSGVER